jgi:hypothetical protein
LATWPELRSYIADRYTIAGEHNDVLALDFRLPNGRTQLVTIQHYTMLNGDEHWALVESAFAKVGAVDLHRAVSLVETMVCGGIAKAGDLLTLRHAIPLSNLDINEFERPLNLVTSSADELEAKLTGGDAF